MGDVTDLLEAFELGTLVRPSPLALNLVDLSRAVARWGGAHSLPPAPGEEALRPLIGDTQHLVLVLADGLGMSLLELLPPGAFLPSRVALTLRTVFPSTTAVALTSLATGQWPAQHGVVGWWTHLPQIKRAATILQYLTRDDRRSLSDLGVTPSQAYPVPSALGSYGCDTLALFPERISQGAYTSYFTGGKAVRGYHSLTEAVNLAVERVRQAEGPTFTYLYTPRVDDTAHAYGMARPETQAAVYDLDREMERLAAGLPAQARLLLTADHGFLDCPEGSRHEFRFYDPLLGLLWYPPSGDARVMYLHVRPGNRGRIRDYFFRRFGDRFLVITTEEAEELEVFGPGPLSGVARERLGDLMAISQGADAMEYRPAGGNGRVMQEASQHSGLSPQEVLVPLVAA
ncbi:MAG: alkaline phosphatase family protein [Chloroflexi bacterium]|nr:alkaline phosphatase family protein [Chloroflexota bacterium]